MLIFGYSNGKEWIFKKILEKKNFCFLKSKSILEKVRVLKKEKKKVLNEKKEIKSKSSSFFEGFFFFFQIIFSSNVDFL